MALAIILTASVQVSVCLVLEKHHATRRTETTVGLRTLIKAVEWDTSLTLLYCG